MNGTSTAIAVPATRNVAQEAQKKNWTIVNWSKTVSETVASKTHRYLGWVVAAITVPFTFIPALVVDGYHGAKNLFQRNATKPSGPVQNKMTANKVQNYGGNKPGVKQSRTNNPDPSQAMNAPVSENNSAPDSEKQKLQAMLEQSRQDYEASLGMYQRQIVELQEIVTHLRTVYQQSASVCQKDIARSQQKVDEYAKAIGEVTIEKKRAEVELAETKKQLESVIAELRTNVDELNGALDAAIREKGLLAEAAEGFRVQLEKRKETTETGPSRSMDRCTSERFFSARS